MFPLPCLRLEWRRLGKISLFIFFFLFLPLEGCFFPLPLAEVVLLLLHPCPLSLFITLCAGSLTFLRTMSRIFILGSAMSIIMFCPVASASEHMALAPCHSNGRTNERHSPPRILPILWLLWRKGGLLNIEPIPFSARPRPSWCR